MAKIEGRPTIDANIVLVLNEQEAAALDALRAYGTDEFLRAFYQSLGRSVLEPHEEGIRTLFNSLSNGTCGVGAILKRLRDARKVFNGELITRVPDPEEVNK